MEDQKLGITIDFKNEEGWTQEIYAGCFAYADDLALISEWEQLEEVIENLTSWAEKYKLEIADKTKWMIWKAAENRNWENIGNTIEVGNLRIERVTSF